jgi:hypothetical protein
LAGRTYKSNARAIFRTAAGKSYLSDFIDDLILTEGGAFGFPDGLSDYRSENRTPLRMRLTGRRCCYDAATINHV